MCYIVSKRYFREPSGNEIWTKFIEYFFEIIQDKGFET